MRATTAVFLATLFFALPANAQFSVDNGNGETVTIGPNGINVHSTNERSNVSIGRDGIRVNSKNRNINRSSTTVRSNRPGVSKTVVTTTNGMSLADKLLVVENAAYGQSYPNKPLLVRLDELEVKVVGHTTLGSSGARLDALAKALGVSFGNSNTNNHVSTSTSTTTVRGTTNGTVSGDNVVVMNGDDVNQTVNMSNGSLVINSNNCHLKLNGACDKLVINGNNNWVDGDRVAFVQSNGNDNHVTWRGKAPFVNDQGNRNQLTAARE